MSPGSKTFARERETNQPSVDTHNKHLTCWAQVIAEECSRSMGLKICQSRTPHLSSESFALFGYIHTPVGSSHPRHSEQVLEETLFQQMSPWRPCASSSDLCAKEPHTPLPSPSTSHAPQGKLSPSKQPVNNHSSSFFSSVSLLASALLSLFHFMGSSLPSCLPLNSAFSPMTGLGRTQSHLEKGKQKVPVLQPGEANLPLACYLPLLPSVFCLSLWTPSPKGSPCLSQHPGINLINFRKEEKWKERGRGLGTIRDLNVRWGKGMKPTQAATRLPVSQWLSS